MRAYRLRWKRGVGYWEAQVRVFGFWQTISEHGSQAEAEKVVWRRIKREHESQRDTTTILYFKAPYSAKFKEVIQGNFCVKWIGSVSSPFGKDGA